MGTTAHKGVGQGKGGGRPRRADDVVQVRLSLPGKVHRVLEDRALEEGRPMWTIVAELVAKGVASTDPLPAPVATAPAPPPARRSRGGWKRFCAD